MSSGFAGAPVLKALSVLTAAGSVLAIRSGPGLFALDAARVLSGQQLWRLLSSQLACGNMQDLICCLFLLYHFRSIERQMGVRKFGFFAACSCFFGVTIQLSSRMLLGGPNTRSALSAASVSPGWANALTTLAPGPLALLFSMFPLFHARIPRLRWAQYSVCGVPLTNKTLSYIVGGLLLASGRGGLLPALSGLVVGMFFLGDKSAA